MATNSPSTPAGTRDMEGVAQEHVPCHWEPMEGHSVEGQRRQT